MTNILTTHNLTKTIQGVEIISNVNMSIRKGEIYGFLGPNGAGKTTIMKMMMNLMKPTDGEIEIFGQKVTPSSYDILKRMGSMIEYPIFYEKLTAKENLELHCEYMGFHHKKEIPLVLEKVKLHEAMNKVVKNFSLGMKQRLGIARAIITKPELLILDEPINGLDPVGIKEIRDLFVGLNQDYGITMLISSHILKEIEQIADTIGVIHKGKLTSENSMEKIQSQYTDYIEIATNSQKKACFVLEDKLQITNYKVVEDKYIRIFDTHTPLSVISKTLILNNIEIESIYQKQASLEEYFFDHV